MSGLYTQRLMRDSLLIDAVTDYEARDWWEDEAYRYAAQADALDAKVKAQGEQLARQAVDIANRRLLRGHHD